MTYIVERRQEEKEQRRSDILDAAERVAARQGFEKVSLGHIAKEARLSRPLLYTYFADKEDLFSAVLHRGLLRLHHAFEGAAADHELGLDKVGAIGHAFVEFAIQYPVYYNALAHFEAQELDMEKKNPNQLACQEAGGRVNQVTATAVKAGVADGSIRPDVGDPMCTAITLWGFMHGLVQLWTKKGPMLIHHYKIDAKQFMEQGFAMARHSMAYKQKE